MGQPSLKAEWVEYCLGLSAERADFYSGCRKILRERRMVFTALDDSLQLTDAGFTRHKMRYLERAYMHEESLRVAVDLWARRRVQDKYGSVGVTCYNHFVKGGDSIADVEAKKSKRASVMGPCIQSMVVTYLDRRTYAVDMFYRTTELLKKFPADLVFARDVLLKPFDFSGMKLDSVNCHFANVTIHPMYFATVLPLIPDPVAAFELLKERDKYFHDWVVKWTARYVCDEFHRGIAKFAQALRVHKDARERILPDALEAVQAYIRANHPPLKTRFAEANQALGQDVVEDDDEGESE
jgi:hypothetical protein